MNDSISISVRHLVEFVLRSGDIDRRHSSSSTEAMQMGSMIHRKLQEEQSGGDYRAEVPLKYTYETDEYELIIEGRADGVIDSDGQIIVDEIKSVYGDVKNLGEPKEVHLAQAKVYAAIILNDRALKEIGVRMTYCSMDTMEIQYFHYSYTIGEITGFLKELIRAYDKWARFIVKWKKIRNSSASELCFPYPYREGQKELAADVYRTIYHKKRLFLMAPTGVGKTLSVTFPAVKALGEGRTDKIFYLTGKTVTGQAAVEAFEVMTKKGLQIKTVVIAGREKVCLNDTLKCNPDECPYAKGHFDRVNKVLYTLLTTADIYSREKLLEVSMEAGVCPYELSLDLASFADAVICDYNYVFDPNAALSDYFAPGKSGNELVLVDEAHNLVERARDMYSAAIDSARAAAVKKKLRNAVKNGEFSKKLPTKAATQLGRLVKLIESLCEEHGDFSENVETDEITAGAIRALSLFEDMMDVKELKGLFDDEEILNFYFELSGYSFVAGLYDDNYVNYIERTHENNVRLKLMCVNPSSNLMEYLGKRSAVFFSATLIPVGYYIDLISGDRQDYTVYAKSTFKNNRCAHLIVEDVSSRYKQRGEQTYRTIAHVIYEVISQKKGNYLVFFPSYRFMEEVFEIFEKDYPNASFSGIKQDKSMSEEAREAFLKEFRDGKGARTLVGFCVLGGVFSEGIDLKEDALIGAVVVGTGLPMLTKERELLKKYFDEREMDGFDYAYKFPGLIKVLQAAGRVIRTERDAGVVVLLDERFTGRGYKGLFPAEWDNITGTDSYGITQELNKFWSSLNEGYLPLSSIEAKN